MTPPIKRVEIGLGTAALVGTPALRVWREVIARLRTMQVLCGSTGWWNVSLSAVGADRLCKRCPHLRTLVARSLVARRTMLMVDTQGTSGCRPFGEMALCETGILGRLAVFNSRSNGTRRTLGCVGSRLCAGRSSFGSTAAQTRRRGAIWRACKLANGLAIESIRRPLNELGGSECSNSSGIQPRLPATFGSTRPASSSRERFFGNPLMRSIPDEYSEFEERWNTMGQAQGGRLLVVSHTWNETGGGTMLVRMISACQATLNEQRQYESG